MVKIVAQTLKPTFGQINTVFAKAYRPEKHIEDVQIDIIVGARFCNFRAVSRSVWRAISYQMGRTGAQENSQGKAYNFFWQVATKSLSLNFNDWRQRRDIEAKQQKTVI